jgi:hypothetical protein
MVWRGRSGRCYTLLPERDENFILAEENLYLLAKGDDVSWVGTAGDLIDDHTSRQRFRRAVAEASAVFRMAGPRDLLTRMTIAWDLEAGERMSELSAA